MRTKLCAYLLCAVVLVTVGTALAFNGPKTDPGLPTTAPAEALAISDSCCVTGDCCCPGAGACCDPVLRAQAPANAVSRGPGCCEAGNCCCPGEGSCCGAAGKGCCSK
jgi:hypothetical protein